MSDPLPLDPALQDPQSLNPPPYYVVCSDSTNLVTTTKATNINSIGIVTQNTQAIYDALCDKHQILKAQFDGFSTKAAQDLCKLAYLHIHKNRMSTPEPSLFNEFVEHGVFLINEAVEFAKIHEKCQAESASSKSDVIDEDLDIQIIWYSLQCYCGLAMLLGALLFWSVDYPHIEFSKQFVGVLGKIYEASELYESLLKNTTKAKMNSDDDEKGGHIKADHKHLLEDSSVTMFKEITEGCKIIGTISDYLSKTSFLNRIFGVDDGNGSSECGGKYLGRCPKDLFDWANNFQTTEHFLHGAVMERKEKDTSQFSEKS
ncbi:hypothetical protein H4219_004618 [Mycoemilia scoparia]|uniref:Uncharacterized protein n=1 Tax=Mycoemilia scoparia TaxID=417184 RepID=A0A9W8DQV4_9FUNG|nr:hypothetical protein H4219_004618 [Mycoemilia scoparia]